MNSDDPFLRTLQAADAAATPPLPQADLPQQVRQRHARQLRTVRKWKIGVAGTAMMLVCIATFIIAHKLPVRPGDAAPMDATLAGNPRAEPGANGLSPSDILQLRVQADALGAEADALQRQLTAVRQEQTRQDLRDEYRRQLAANAQTDTGESAIDRAAAIALCQGDYYWEQQARQPARAAYQSVLDNFPQSHWAVVAQERLNQFQMN
ncbi:MAG TPA: hypothetical protein VFE46_04350 [Pirellulales bacterium]|jgi:hypothetical protein|nr:hypothetical protein [Pirellulales bacterium]